MIDQDNKRLGIFSTAEALKLAKERGLDLVEINSFANPPVAKIIDFGKWLYQKEKREGKKEVKKREIKIIKIGLATERHDLEIKAKKIEEFLKHKHKVIIELPLQGRQMALKDLAKEKIKNFLELIKESYQIEGEIMIQPRNLKVLIKPQK